MTELIILILFSGAIIACLAAKASIIYALLLGYCLFFIYGLLKKQSPLKMLKESLASVLSIKTILITFILIGMLTASWRACGTIPFIICHITKACLPALTILFSFLLCAFVSVLTGTSFGTAATMGIICMTLAESMGFSPLYTGGAVLSGIYLGDRCSPISTSALLSSELTKTSIYKNIHTMIKTSIIPFWAACIFYLLIGFLTKPTQSPVYIQTIFAENFNLQPLTAVPAVIIIVLALWQINVKTTMLVSITAAAVISFFLQHMSISAILHLFVYGYQTANPELAALLGGGGIISMGKVLAIVCLSSCYSGIFKCTGFLDNIQNFITLLKQKTNTFSVILLTSILTGLISCNQTLTIMLTYQLCQDIEKNNSALASHLENTAVVIPALIPWSLAAAIPLALISAPSTCILFAAYLYLIPLCNYLASLGHFRPRKLESRRAA